MPIRIGFIGTGGVSAYHFANLEQIKDAHVVAMYDMVTAKAEMAARRFPGCKVYSIAEDMLNGAQLDALYVCLPPHAHPEYEIEAAKRGIHLFVEKPVGVDLAKAQEAARVIEEAKIITSVGYNWRYLDTTAAAKEAIEGKDVALAIGYWLGGFPQVSWWRRRSQSGGQVIEQTTHIFDLARYLLGEVESVYGLAYSGLMADWEGYDVDDASSVVLRFLSGTVANISSADVVPRGAATTGIQMFTRDLVIHVSTSSVKFSTPYQVEEQLTAVNAYMLEDQAFISAVRDRDATQIKSSYADAVTTLALTLAVEKSIATEQVVKLEQTE